MRTSTNGLSTIKKTCDVKLNINAKCLKCIESIKYYDTAIIPEYMLTKEVTLDNNSSKEEVLKLIAESISFSIDSIYSDYTEKTEGFITCLIKRNDTELQKYKDNQILNKNYKIKQLKKLFDDNETYAIQIETYLIDQKLQWILELIKT